MGIPIELTISKIGNMSDDGRRHPGVVPYLGLRFSYYREWLREHNEVALAVLTDAFDTQIVNDPFSAMESFLHHQPADTSRHRPPIFVQREWRSLRATPSAPEKESEGAVPAEGRQMARRSPRIGL